LPLRSGHRRRQHGDDFAIVCDLFGETSARTKIANVVVAINVVTVIAPIAGAALLTIGGWRLIYMIQAGIGALLLLALVLGFAESARIDPANRLAPALAIRSYVRVASAFVRIRPGWRGQWRHGVCLCHRILAVLRWRSGIAAGPVWPDL
jgi:MFS family permease